MQRIDARRPGAYSLLALRRRHAGDLLCLLHGVLAGHLMERIPHRASLVHGSVFERYLYLTRKQRWALRQPLGIAFLETVGEAVGLGSRIGERRLIGQPCIGNKRLVRMLDPCAGGGDAVLLALPHAKLGIPVRETLVRLVPHHEALVLAIFLEVGLGQQLRLHVDAAVALHQPALRQLGLVVHVEERRVRPATHHRVIVSFVFDDPVEPRQRQRAVGAGTKRQPDVGFLAQRRDARIHHDMLRRTMRDVGDRAVRGVVVGVLARRAPLHVHAGLGLHLHPRGPHLVGHDAAEVARAFAHLVGQMRVRRAEQLLHALVRPERPHARRAAHHEDGLPAVLLLHFLELLAAYLERLVQRDAHPTGIVLALRVRALHRETKAVGMI